MYTNPMASDAVKEMKRSAVIRSTWIWMTTALILLGAGGLHGDPLDSLAARLEKGAANLPGRKVAVLTFTYADGAVSSGSSLVTEGLTTRLVNRRAFSVIERSQLEKLMSESKLQLSGVVDSSGTPKIGRVLGVNGIITGRLIDLTNGQTSIDARLISAANGEVLAAGAAQIKRTWYDLPRLPSDSNTSAYTPR
jgi:TolB-like protein